MSEINNSGFGNNNIPKTSRSSDRTVKPHECPDCTRAAETQAAERKETSLNNDPKAVAGRSSVHRPKTKTSTERDFEKNFTEDMALLGELSVKYPGLVARFSKIFDDIMLKFPEDPEAYGKASETLRAVAEIVLTPQKLADY